MSRYEFVEGERIYDTTHKAFGVFRYSAFEIGKAWVLFDGDGASGVDNETWVDAADLVPAAIAAGLTR